MEGRERAERRILHYHEITHTKQQIRPHEYLTEILAPDLEATAKALNSRVRQSHLQLRMGEHSADVERLAATRDRLLQPLPRPKVSAKQQTLIEELTRRHPNIHDQSASSEENLQYRIVHDTMNDTSFYTVVMKDGLLILVLNPQHPFYRKLYEPIAQNESKEVKDLRTRLELMLLAAARAEAEAKTSAQREALQTFRKIWSDNLATFLNG